ncbi:MAG: DUF1553 domain-containing protein [Isosphaeraceae bacterium]
MAERDERQYRRGVYNHWQRTFLHPMLANFDAPSREDCVALRTNANSPQQALTLLNDPEFVEAARFWAASLLAKPGDDRARIERAYVQALSRAPRAIELESLVGFLAKARAEYRNRPDDAWRARPRRLCENPCRRSGGAGGVDHGVPRHSESTRDDRVTESGDSRASILTHEHRCDHERI